MRYAKRLLPAVLPLAMLATACASSPEGAGAVPERTAYPNAMPVASAAGRTDARPAMPRQGGAEPDAYLARTHSDHASVLGSANASNLQPAWHIETKDMVSHTPLVQDGRVYFADWGGTVYAADARTGKVIWQNSVEKPKPWPWHGFAGTGTLGGGMLFQASVEGNAFALDPQTGKVIWQTRVTEQPHAGVLSPLLYHDGLVYMGLQSVDEALDKMKEGFKPSFQGSVLALDARTGRKVWERRLVEAPGTGVPVWSELALDPAMGALFFGTGNNYVGEATPLSDSVIALDSKTGEILWHHQATPHDVWTMANVKGPDFDFGAGAQLVEANGRRLVVIGQKSGVLWALDRATGEVVWQTVIGYSGVGGGMRGEASIGPQAIYAWSNNSYIDGKPPEEFPIDVKAIDPATGKYLWVKPKAQPAVGISAGFLAGDVYFVGSLDGKVRGYRASDGELVWTSPAHGAVASDLMVDGGMLLWGAGVPKKFGGATGQNGVFAYSIGPR